MFKKDDNARAGQALFRELVRGHLDDVGHGAHRVVGARPGLGGGRSGGPVARPTRGMYCLVHKPQV